MGLHSKGEITSYRLSAQTPYNDLKTQELVQGKPLVFHEASCTYALSHTGMHTCASTYIHTQTSVHEIKLLRIQSM